MSTAHQQQADSLKPAVDKNGFKYRFTRDARINKYVYLMLLPVVVYYILFYYVPMYGLQIAFKDYSPGLGFLHSDWVGLKHFRDFFGSYYFARILRNTLLISFYELLFMFPASILLALLLNELRSALLRRTVQTITYMPHFISIVVVAGMLRDFLASDGLINNLLSSWFGVQPIGFLGESGWFRTIFISSNIWQNIGWGSIIYLSAMAGIDPTLYEAARVDGAKRFRQVVNVTLPGIMPTVVILLILQIGNFMSVGADKILLLYNPTTYETADVIGTFVYRKGILESSFSYSAAVGLFNSLINFTLLVLANTLSRRISDHKLW